MCAATPRPDPPTPPANGAIALLAGDWHGNGAHARWTIDEAVRIGADRIFQLGDFGYWEHQPIGVRFLDDLNEYAAGHGITVHFLDGNHDKTSLLLAAYTDHDDGGFVIVRSHIRYAPRGHRWTWNAVRFIALGGAYSVDRMWRLAREQSSGEPETLWFPEEQMSDSDLDSFLTDDAPVDVLLCHDKPRSSKPWLNRKNTAECFPNQDRIDRAATVLAPALIAHGHLHVRYTERVCFDGVWCTVEGLDADPAAANGARAGSVLALPLDTVPARPTE